VRSVSRSRSRPRSVRGGRCSRSSIGWSDRTLGVHDAVDAIKAVIEDKTRFSELDEIVLALDATDSPRYALRAVADAFQAQHVAWAAGVGYQAIWLVGPVADLVHRLDI
jgi:hypothetical protein